MKYLLLFIGLVASHQIVVAQQVPVSTEQQLENLAELLGEDIDDSYLQQLYYLQKHPISLNKASEEDLQQLKWLTDLQIQSFLQYRRVLGALQSIYELQAISTWDLMTIKKVLPFVTLEEEITLKNIFSTRLKEGQHTLFLRTSRIIEKQKGYDDEASTHYAGSPDRLLVRYRYQYKNLLQYGVTAEKDAGEAFFKGAQSQGFDFYSFHLFARQLGSIKTLAIGDFTVNMGQGLVQWQSLSFKKNAETMQVKRQGVTLQPYTAATEYNFNRGVGATWQKGAIEATAFSSWRKISGNSGIDTLDNEDILTSFYNTGLHRTPSEIDKRNAIDYWAMGGVLSYKKRSFKVSGNAMLHQFSHTLQKSDKPYDIYGIEGKKWSNYSVDYSWTYKNIHTFGEVAIDSKQHKALLSGALISVDSKVDVSLIYRNIQPSYQTLWGSAFTETILPANEKGLYTGLSIRPAYGWRIDAYADIYQFPWLKFGADAPSKGKDFLLQTTYQPNKQVEVYVRYKIDTKEKNASADSIVHYLTALPKQSLRLHIVYKLNTSFSLKGRTELVWYDRNETQSEEGFLTYLQGDYTVNSKLKGNIRLQYFETEGFNSRIYAYESDVLYGYSIPPFFDKGFRYYINVNYDISKKLTIWGRWAQTLYDDKRTIGSGLYLINGNKRSEYKLQFRYSF